MRLPAEADGPDFPPEGRARTRGGGTPAPTRAAVILPWERPERSGEASRAAEARLAEAVGLTASIGLVVVHTAILPLRARPATLLGEGQMQMQG